MNIWKPVNRKSKKIPHVASVPTDPGAALPDVVAGLSFDDTGHDISTPTESAMIGYTTYYPESQETRGRRREPRSHHNITPQGIGASPSGGYLHPQELGVVPAPPLGGTQALPSGGTLRRSNAAHPWPQTTSAGDFNWNQTCAATRDGVSYGQHNFPAHGEGLEGARIRSMSSEPHGNMSIRNDERRIRCSSATRNRQSRSNSNNVAFATAASRNLSPPSSSPPVQRIEYQQNATVASAAGNTMQGNMRSVAGASRDEERVNENNNQADLRVPGCSYGYQVPDLDALLTHASPTRPANLPMVLASSTRLHNMRRSQEHQTTTNETPVRPILPLGIIVNAVFKTRDWLFVRTAHGAEGYVPFRVCLPLGILPPNRTFYNANNNVASGTSPWEIRGNETSSASKSQAAFSSNTLGSQPRARHRGRRRVNNENTNQTDLQKLQPNNSRSSSNNRPRETLEPPPSDFNGS